MASSDSQFNAMQEEAIKRVREMYRRSQSMVQPVASVEDTVAPVEETPAERKNTRAVKHSNSASGGLMGGFTGDILKGLKIDEEKALIGLLIYILYKQGADIKLLLGLGYLLL